MPVLAEWDALGCFGGGGTGGTRGLPSESFELDELSIVSSESLRRRFGGGGGGGSSDGSSLSGDFREGDLRTKIASPSSTESNES